jgi:AsmA protein
MLKWALIAVGALVLLVAGILLALPYLVDTPAIQAQVAQAAGHALGRPVKFQSLSISALPLPTVRLKGLEVAEDPAFGGGPFLTVGEGRIGIRLRPLLSGRIELADLTLEEPRVQIIQDRSGRLNVASLGAPAGTAAPGAPRSGPGRSGAAAAGAVLVSAVQIRDGILQYRKQGAPAPLVRLERVNLTVSQPAPGESLRLSGSAVAEPGAVSLRLAEATLAPAGARSLMDAPLKAVVEVEARDVAALSAVFLAAPAVSGPVAGRLELAGTAARPTATGRLEFGRLTLSERRPQCGGPQPRRLEVSEVLVPVALGPAELESRPVRAKAARGSLSFNLKASLAPVGQVRLSQIEIRGMELGPVLVDYLCQGAAVTGPLDLTGEARFGAADPLHSLDGAGKVRIGPGRVVGQDLLNLVEQVAGLAGAASALGRPGRAARGVDSPLEFESITATYTVTNGVARTEDLLYKARSFTVAGAGTYGLADGRVAMDVTFTQGNNEVKGRVAGAGGSYRVVPTSVKLEESRGLRRLLDRLLR